MKMMIIGDMHLKKITSEIEQKYRNKVLNFVKETIEEHKIKDVLQLGDFFHNRKSLDIQVYYDTIKQMQDTFKNTHFLTLVGNHDTYYKSTNSVYSTQILQNLSNFFVVEKIAEINNKVICPWINEENIQEFEQALADIKDKYLFGHFEINGFAKVKGFDETDGISASKFKDAKKVFSGHFHLTQDKNNICYVGSLFQENFNDANDIKRVIILDTKTDEIKEIRIPFALFERISITDEEQMTNELINSFKDKIVQVIFNIQKSVKRERFHQKLLESEINADIKVIDNSALLEEKVELNNTNDDIIDVFSDYVKISETIDDDRKEALKNVFIESFNKVKEL